MANISSNDVLNALRKVQDPDLNSDIVSLGMVRDVNISGSEVSLRVVLTTPACPMKAKIEADVRQALSGIGVSSANIKMDADTRRKQPTTGTAGMMIPGVSHIIAVSSGKGGVGKSTVSTNLAVALQLEGARVGLMDADVYGPNIPTMIGVTDQPRLVNHSKLGEVFLPPVARGVKVMSMGFLIDGDQPLAWRGPMLHNVMRQFCHQVDWGDLDYLVIDLPPGTGDVQLSLSQLIPLTGAVMVTTPQEISMQDVRKAFGMFEKVHIPVLGIVENMSYFEVPGTNEKHHLFGQGGGRKLADKYNTELLAEIPLVQKVREGGDVGRPVVASDPDSPIAMKFRELARKVAQRVSILTADQKNPTEFIQIGRFN